MRARSSHPEREIRVTFPLSSFRPFDFAQGGLRPGPKFFESSETVLADFGNTLRWW